MNARTRRALLAGVIIAACGAFVGAQAAKPASKAKRMRVFFIEPKNNATVTSPVHMKFGAEGIEIAAVPPGDVTTTRPGVAQTTASLGFRPVANAFGESVGIT